MNQKYLENIITWC